MGEPAKACIPKNQCIYEIFSASFWLVCVCVCVCVTQVLDFSFPNRD